VLCRIFGPKRNDVTREWKSLHNEELHNVFSSSYITITKQRIMWGAGHAVHVADMRKTYRNSVHKPEPLQSSRYKWEDNIKIDHTERGY
jgi:hypothetical protein